MNYLITCHKLLYNGGSEVEVIGKRCILFMQGNESQEMKSKFAFDVSNDCPVNLRKELAFRFDRNNIVNGSDIYLVVNKTGNSLISLDSSERITKSLESVESIETEIDKWFNYYNFSVLTESIYSFIDVLVSNLRDNNVAVPELVGVNKEDLTFSTRFLGGYSKWIEMEDGTVMLDKDTCKIVDKCVKELEDFIKDNGCLDYRVEWGIKDRNYCVFKFVKKEV